MQAYSRMMELASLRHQVRVAAIAKGMLSNLEDVVPFIQSQATGVYHLREQWDKSESMMANLCTGLVTRRYNCKRLWVAVPPQWQP